MSDADGKCDDFDFDDDDDFDVQASRLRKTGSGGGLGISLEGTVDVEDGVEVGIVIVINSPLQCQLKVDVGRWARAANSEAEPRGQ